MITSCEAAGDHREDRLRRLFDAGHAGLLLLLVLWRPLACGMVAGYDSLCWAMLPSLGVLFCLMETAVGLRPRWRWTWTPLVAVVLLAGLVPAILRASDPSSAASDWLDLAAILVLAVYLMQAVPGRRRLVTAIVGATLCVQLLLAWGQYGFVLPQLSDGERVAELWPGADPDLVADLRERAERGGVYATYTLANGFALFLVMAGLLVGGAVWAWRAHWVARGAAFAVLAGAIVPVYILTSVKGSIAAGAAASAWVGTARLSPVPRWLLRFLGVAALVGVFWWQPAPVQPSIAVRAGYFRSAAGLIAEQPWTGHGWHHFAVAGGRHLPPAAEFSRRVHNAWMEMAVSAGVPLALLLAGLMLTWMRQPFGPRYGHDRIDDGPGGRLWRWLLLLGIPLLLAYVTCFDTLATDNLGLWPGVAGRPLGLMLAALLIGVPAAGVAVLLLRLPAPPRAATLAAVGTFGLGSLIDFHFDEAALVGFAVVGACLGADSEQPLRLGRLGGLLVAMLAIGILAGQMFRMHRHLQREQVAEDLGRLAAIGRTTDADLRRQQLAILAESYPGIGPGLQEHLLRRGYEMATAFPADRELLRRVAEADPDLRRRYDQLMDAITAGRFDVLLLRTAADAAWRLQRVDAALDLVRLLVIQYPFNLLYRQYLWNLLRQAAANADEEVRRRRYRSEMEATGTFIDQNLPRVFFRSRRGMDADWRER